MGLPEFRQWADQIESCSNGRVRAAAMLDGELQLGKKASGQYWVVRAFESHPQHTVTWNWFYVKQGGGEVLVADPLGGKAMTLQSWRHNGCREYRGQ